MNTTKIIIAIVALAAIATIAVGLASAQIGATQTPDPTVATPNSGFWGWVGNCFRFGNGQPAGAQIQPPAYPVGPYDTAAPYTAAPNPYQGGYGYGYGNGPCMARFW